MKEYKRLEFEITVLNSSDIISTSPVTGEITPPWAKGQTENDDVNL